MKKTILKILNLAIIAAILISLAACENSSTTSSSQAAVTTGTEASTETSSVSTSASNEASNSENQHYPVTIETYKYSKEPITITFKKAPERVYAVNPTSVENMIALGLEDKIAKISLGSRDRLTDAGKALYDKLGGQQPTLTKEEVLGSDIDFILGWYSTFSEKNLGEVDFWHEKGINTYIALNSSIKKPAPNTLEDEYEDIRNLGKIFNVEERAEQIIKEMDAKIAAVQKLVEKKGKTRVLVLEVEKDNQIRLYGPETIGGVIAEKVGADLLTNEPRINGEQLIELNPDVIFSVYFGPDTSITQEDCIKLLVENPAYKNISAVASGKVYPITLSFTYATGVRTSEAIEYMSKILHPELDN